MRNKFPRANDPTQTCRYVAVRQVETSRDVRSKVAVTGEPATADFGGDEPSEGVSEHL
jgi:hypothetical protein